MSLAILLSYIVIATIPVYFAAVQPWIWAYYAVAMALAYLIYLWSDTGQSRDTSKLWLVCGGFFFAWTAFQCVPLPADILAALSPYRYRALQEGAALTGIPLEKAAISYSIYESMAWWILLLVSSAFYVVLRNGFLRSGRLRLLMKILLVLAALQALYGILQALIPSIGVLGVNANVGIARGTFINRNHFAGMMEMLFPLCLGYTLAFGDWEIQGGKKKRMKMMLASDRQTPPLLLGVILVTMLVATLFSQSRAGIMSTIIGFFVFSVLFWVGNKRLPLGFWIGIAAIVGLTFVYGSRIGFEEIINRFMAIEGGNERTKVWSDCLVLLKDHPLGIGLMGFRTVFRVYEVSTNVTGTFAQAHNDILQLLLEAGWPGFVALFGAFLTLLAVKSVQICRMRPANDPLRFFLAAGALSGLVSMGFHSFFDFNLQMPANLVYFVMLLAVLNACTDSKLAADPRRQVVTKKKHVASGSRKRSRSNG